MDDDDLDALLNYMNQVDEVKIEDLVDDEE